MITRILEFFRAWPHAWWFLQVLGCSTIFLCNIAAGVFGFRWFVYMFNVINVILYVLALKVFKVGLLL